MLTRVDIVGALTVLPPVREILRGAAGRCSALAGELGSQTLCVCPVQTGSLRRLNATRASEDSSNKRTPIESRFCRL